MKTLLKDQDSLCARAADQVELKAVVNPLETAAIPVTIREGQVPNRIQVDLQVDVQALLTSYQVLMKGDQLREQSVILVGGVIAGKELERKLEYSCLVCFLLLLGTSSTCEIFLLYYTYQTRNKTRQRTRYDEYHLYDLNQATKKNLRQKIPADC